MTGTAFKVTFWGVRGSLALGGPETAAVGTNTPCVEVLCGERVFILDAGSGLARLGDRLQANHVQDIDLFLSHCHYDHIVGLPFFCPLYDPDADIRIWSGHLAGAMSTREIVAAFMRPPFFPVGPDVFPARIDYRDFAAGEVLDMGGGVRVATAPLNHPGHATGYRFDHAGRSVAYVTDTEHRPGAPDEAVLGLIADADLVIYDACFTDDELARFKGYGHSTWQEGVRLCRQAGARRLAIFHHRHCRTDAALEVIEAEARRAFPQSFVAREGMVVDL